VRLNPYKAVMVLLVVCGLVVPMIAQDKPTQATATEQAKAPALTDVQKLGIVNLAKDIQIAQLQAQAAQAAFDKAQAELQKLIASLQVPGYTLDLNTMTYTTKPAEKTGGGMP
jgi:hypothetical protein